MNHEAITHLQTKIDDTNSWLDTELGKIRTGRATPSFLDAITIESYGSMMPLNQVASVTAEDAKTLRIAPWDSSMVKTIESSITKADLGVSVSTDEKGVRVHFPDLTTETRERVAKTAKTKHEDARIALRGARDDARSDVQKAQKNGELSEDELRDLQTKIDEMVAKANKSFDEKYDRKYDELTSI